LQVEEGLSLPSVAELIAALQRVPGVLLADFGAGSARAVVAHDAGVPRASLLAAAERAGVHARIVNDARAPTADGNEALRLGENRTGRLLALVGGLALLAAIAEAFNPRLASNAFVMPILLSTVWAFVVARAILRRRR
jgi:hypothetical protein